MSLPHALLLSPSPAQTGVRLPLALWLEMPWLRSATATASPLPPPLPVPSMQCGATPGALSVRERGCLPPNPCTLRWGPRRPLPHLLVHQEAGAHVGPRHTDAVVRALRLSRRLRIAAPPPGLAAMQMNMASTPMNYNARSTSRTALPPGTCPTLTSPSLPSRSSRRQAASWGTGTGLSRRRATTSRSHCARV
jgi:hypothetical protein